MVEASIHFGDVLAPLREKVLAHLFKHEFPEAANILASIFVLPANKHFTDFLTGRSVIHNNYHSNAQQVQDFYSSVVDMMTSKSEEMDARYQSALAAISNWKLMSAQQVLSLKARKTKKTEKISHENLTNTAHYQGILGIINFFQWQEEKSDQEKYEKACGHFYKATQLDTHGQGFMYFYCLALLEQQEVDKIIRSLTTFRENNPKNPLSHRMLGTMLLHHKKYELMVECFKDELRLDPVSDVAFQVLVNIFFTQSEPLVTEKEILHIIFQFVDHLPTSASMSEEEPLPWEVLYTVLQKAEIENVKEFLNSNPHWFRHHFECNTFIGPFEQKCKHFLLKQKLVPKN